MSKNAPEPPPPPSVKQSEARNAKDPTRATPSGPASATTPTEAQPDEPTPAAEGVTFTDSDHPLRHQEPPRQVPRR